MPEQKPLETISLAQAGIPAERVQRLLSRLEERRLCMHSLLLVRHGKLAAEGYWKPFEKDRKHRMYSTTKSFVSVAIGLLIGEGRLTLEDHICDYFPEKLPPEGPHPFTAAMTVRDLLMMASAHAKTTYRCMQDDDWVRTFFVYPPSHLPGTIFSYDTSATTVLTALVEKLSGQRFLEYLRPRLLDPLGFSADAYCTETPLGLSWGGSGLICTPRDLAKFAICCMDGGRYRGQQLIPEAYIRMATSRQIDNTVANSHVESQQGYGFQFWRTRHDGFACRGMGSQLAICQPNHDFIMVTTADTQMQPNGEFEIFDALWEELLPYLSDSPLPPQEAQEAALQARLEALEVQKALGEKTSPTAAAVSGRTYQMEENDMQLRRLTFTFAGDEGAMEYENATGLHTLRFGFGRHVAQQFPVYDYPCITSAAWKDDDTLHIQCYLIGDYLATLEIAVSFGQGGVTVLMRKAAELFLEEYQGFASGR